MASRGGKYRGHAMFRVVCARAPCAAIRIAVIVCALIALVGCPATRGGPKSFLAVESAKAAGEVQNVAMANLVEAATLDTRNRYMAQAMSDIDVLYVQYRDELLRSDNAFNASVDLLSLLSGLAGSLTDSAGVKNNYLTLGALLTGGRSIVNNRFLYAQTGLALIKGMDAARAASALAFKTKQAMPIERYSGRDAYADVLKYYFDGTLAGGLIWLQSKADQQEASDREKLATLPVPKPEELGAREALYGDIGVPMGKPAALRRALDAWSIDNTHDEPLVSLQNKFRDEYVRRLGVGVSADELRRQLDAARFFED